MIYNKVTFPKPTHSNIWDSRNEKQKREEEEAITNFVLLLK